MRRPSFVFKKQTLMSRSKLFRQDTDNTVVQAFRFIVVGLIAYAIDFSFLMGAVEFWGWNYLVSAAVGYLIGLGVNYVLCVRWVFSHRRFQDQKTEFILFAIIGLTGLGLTEFMLWAGTESLGFDFRLSKIAALFVVAAWNFGLRKMLLFSDIPLVRSQSA